MARISKYTDYDNEGLFDDQWEDDASDMEDYNKVTRCGLDDPLAMRDVDLSTRLDLLHVMMLAYNVHPNELIDFLNLLYSGNKEKATVEKLKKIRAKYRDANNKS